MVHVSPTLQNAEKTEEAGEAPPPPQAPDTPLTISLRLVIQSSQCGSLIGKGGAKIKEIREVWFDTHTCTHTHTHTHTQTPCPISPSLRQLEYLFK